MFSLKASRGFFCLLLALLAYSGTIYGQVNGFWPADINVPAGATNVQWYRNTVAIPGATSPIYSVTQDGTYYADFDDATCGGRSTLTITLTQAPATDLSVSVAPATLSNAEGEVQSYTVTVTNNGPTAAPNAVVRVPIPGERTFLTANTVSGSYDAGTEMWTIGSLANGASATLEVFIRVD